MKVVMDTGGANTPEKALVPLAFDEQGNVLSAETYNKLVAGGKAPVSDFWTDLLTFRQVMAVSSNKEVADSQLKTALPEYSQLMGAESSAVFVYDPFQNIYHTREEDRRLIEQMLKQPQISAQATVDGIKSFNIGDIPYRDANYYFYYFGHTGMITQLDFNTSLLRGSGSVNNSTIVEAAGYGPGVQAVQMNQSFFLPGENTTVLR